MAVELVVEPGVWGATRRYRYLGVKLRLNRGVCCRWDGLGSKGRAYWGLGGSTYRPGIMKGERGVAMLVMKT